MKKLNINESKLCSYQANIFANSIEFDCSSKIFLRRFFNSSYAQKMDDYENHTFSYDIKDCYDQLLEQYGKFTYGKKKISKEILYWLGYITRYICIDKNISSRQLYKMIDLDLLINNYETYHTQSEEWVINRIFDNMGIDKDAFDKKTKIKSVLTKLWL